MATKKEIVGDKTFEEKLKELQSKEKETPLRLKIETSGGNTKRFEVAELQKDFLVTTKGEHIRYSHIGSFVDTSNEEIR